MCLSLHERLQYDDWNLTFLNVFHLRAWYAYLNRLKAKTEERQMRFLHSTRWIESSSSWLNTSVGPSPEIRHLKPPGKKSKTRKKSKRQNSEEDEQPVPTTCLLSAMERVERMQEESLRRLRSLEITFQTNTDTLKSVTDSLEFWGKRVESGKRNSESASFYKLNMNNQVCDDEKHTSPACSEFLPVCCWYWKWRHHWFILWRH